MDKKRRNGCLFWVTLISFVIITIPLIVLRTTELMNYTNFESGFYNGPANLNLAFFILIGAMFIIYIIIAVSIRGEFEYKFYERKNYLIKVLLLICGGFSIVSFLFSRGIGTSERRAVELVFNVIFGLLASVGFFYIYYRVNKNKRSYADILAVLPAIGCAYQLLMMFLNHMNVSTVYEDMLNILRASCLSVFLLNFGKTVCSADQKNTGRWLIFSGLSASTLGFITTISQYIVIVLPYITTGRWGSGYTNSHIIAATPFDFVMTVFTVVFTFKYISQINKKTQADN